MTDQHPITPPLELVMQWDAEAASANMPDRVYIATQAARWGADQELEACVEWVVNTRAYDMTPGGLRTARRPKPPSLKEGALAALATAHGDDHPLIATVITADQHAIIRRAPESLPE
jgi:hypothetical protein